MVCDDAGRQGSCNYVFGSGDQKGGGGASRMLMFFSLVCAVCTPSGITVIQLSDTDELTCGQ